jgi:hypothetical protein
MVSDPSRAQPHIGPWQYMHRPPWLAAAWARRVRNLLIAAARYRANLNNFVIQAHLL